MPSLACSDCATAVPWNAPGCAACGAVFREIRCKSCKYVGNFERFRGQTCPRCSKDRFQTITVVGVDVEEVGADAFIGDVPLEDQIERGLSRPLATPNSPAPADDDAAEGSPKAPDSKSTRPKRRPAPPTPPAGDPRDPPPPAVLKRKRWNASDDVAGSEPEPAENPTKATSTKTEPVRTKKRQITFELSPNVQEYLKWGVMAVPVLLLLAFGAYLLSGPTRKPKIRYGGTTPADTAPDLEARARSLYDAAVDYYRQGQPDQSSTTLHAVVSQFPTTTAAQESRQALDRIAQGLPPFEGVTATTELTAATPPEPSPPPATQPEPPAAAKPKLSIGIPPPGAPSDSEKPADAASPNLIAGAPARSTPPPQVSTLEKASIAPRGLPDGFVAVDAAGVHASGWPIEILCLKDQSHMMLVPGGEFTMGESQGDANVQPAHRVNLKPYYVDRYEVTMLQYKHFLEQRRLANNPYQDLSAEARAAAATDRHPVVGVAWRDAHAYAEWSGKSLPTEAQWEKAARGGDDRLHPWGTGQPKWERPRQPRQIDPVHSFAWDVSPYGCFDMAGNAWEWCADWYDAEFYRFSPIDDPDGPKSSLPPVQYRDPERVVRGGSPEWRVTWRAPLGLLEQPLHVGFRCVLNVERSAPRTGPAPVAAQPPAVRAPPARIPPGGYKF